MNAAFRLYALQNCPFCHQAIEFMQKNNLPGDLVWADNDPIIDAGVKAKTGNEKPLYPILLSRLTSEVIVGYKPEEYERLRKVFDTLVRTGSADLADSKLITGGEGQAPPAEASTGAN